MNGVGDDDEGDDDEGVGVDDAIDGIGSESSVSAEASMDAGLGSGDYGWGDISAVETGPGDTEHGGYETVAQAVMDNVNNPQVAIDFGRENVQYGPEHNFMGFRVSNITGPGQDDIDALDALEGMNSGDTQHSDGAAFPSMYDPAPPVVEPPVIDPITQPGPTTSYEDSILFHFTPRERHSYLVNQIEMGMEPTRGYTGPDGVFVDLTAIYPEIFYPDQVFRQPMVPMSGGGYVDDYRMNRGGIMDLREPHLYNRGGNVMRNIRDEQARVIGVQDDADDQMNRIRYHSGRDARDERFRVAARERNAREEMGRLRGEARYEDTHGRGPRAFNQGGVASLAPVARDMFRKRRLPRAGMVV